MSRFTTTTAENLTFAWGYDTPLGEYFFACFDESKDASEFDEDEESATIFAIANYNTLVPHPDYPEKIQYSNSEIISLINRYPGIVPEEHLSCIVLDVPF